MAAYSILNNYKYPGKSYEILDALSFPLRAAFGGRTIDLVLHAEHPAYPISVRIALFIATIILFPLALITVAALSIKALYSQDRKEVMRLLQNERSAVGIGEVQLGEDAEGCVQGPSCLLPHVNRLFAQKRFESTSADLSIPKEILEGLNEVNPFALKLPPHITFFRGGRHGVLLFEQAPHLVFKRPHPLYKNPRSPGYSEYFTQAVERTKRAASICQENNLYLLHVPACNFIQLQHKQGQNYYIVQERVDLEDGSLSFQQSLWAALCESEDPVLQAYAKELLRQLAVFICKMPYADARYDNVPILRDGRIALFDLDEDGKEGDATIGLTKGIVEDRYYGLFKMVPLKWFDELYDSILPLLSGLDREQFLAVRTTLKEKVYKRIERRQQKTNFLQEHSILENQHLLPYREKPGVSQQIVQLANSQLQDRGHFWDIVTARKIELRESEFAENDREEVPRALKELQNEGQILKYKIRSPFITFFC